MKKVSLLLGTLGGVLAGYVFSNKQLRDELARAKTADTKAKILGKHIQRDGKRIAAEVQEFVQSDDVQQNLGKAKAYVKSTVTDAKKELEKMWKKEAAPAAKKAATSAKRTVGRKVRVRSKPVL